MLVAKFEVKKINKGILNVLECRDCRKSIKKTDIDNVYTLGFAVGTAEDVCILLCENCARKLKLDVNDTVK